VGRKWAEVTNEDQDFRTILIPAVCLLAAPLILLFAIIRQIFFEKWR